MPKTAVDIYGLAIGVKPGFNLSQIRIYGERPILEAKSVLLDLGKRGIVIRHINAHSFTVTPPKAPGLRDFMIKVESSGIPFIQDTRKPSKRLAVTAIKARKRIISLRSLRSMPTS
jgi:hypothetical protein